MCAGTADGYLFCYTLKRNGAKNQERDSESIVCKQTLESTHDKSCRPWSASSGQKLKVGDSEVRIESGNFENRTKPFQKGGGEPAPCILVQINFSLVVVLPDGSEEFQALPVHGLNFPCLYSTRHVNRLLPLQI